MATVRIEHLRRLDHCARGCRRFWARQGWNWSAFLRDGIPAETMEATGDAMAIEVAQLARADEEHADGQ